MREEFLRKNYLSMTVDEILGTKVEETVEEEQSKHYALIEQIKFDDLKNIDSYMGVAIEESELDYSVEYSVFHGEKFVETKSFMLIKDNPKPPDESWDDWMDALKDTVVCLWGQSDLLQTVLSRYHAIIPIKFIDMKLASGKKYKELPSKDIAEELCAMWKYKIERQARIEKDLRDIIWKQEEDMEEQEN